MNRIVGRATRHESSIAYSRSFDYQVLVATCCKAPHSVSKRRRRHSRPSCSRSCSRTSSTRRLFAACKPSSTAFIDASRTSYEGMSFARKTTWRSRLDLEYLDETSNRKASAGQHDDGPKRTRPLRRFADLRLERSARPSLIKDQLVTARGGGRFLRRQFAASDRCGLSP